MANYVYVKKGGSTTRVQEGGSTYSRLLKEGGKVVDGGAKKSSTGSQTADQLIAQSKAMVEQTKREGSKPFASSSYNAPSLGYRAPSSADAIAPVGNLQMPELSPTFPDLTGIGGMTAFYKSMFDVYEKQQQDFEAQRQKQLELQKTQTQPFLDKILGAKSPQEVADEALQETGISPKKYFAEEKSRLAEIEKLNQEFNAVVQAKDEQIAQSYDRMGTNSFISNTQAQIERNAAPRLNNIAANIQSKAAMLEALQGRWQEAQNYVNQAVEYATADLKYNVELYKMFYDINQDVIDNLDTKYTDAVKESIRMAESAYAVAYEEKKLVGKLMLDNPSAGININDTLEDAYRKAGVAPGTENGFSEGFASLEVEQEFRAEALDRLQAVRAGAMTLEAAYEELRTLFSPREVTDAAILSILGMTDVLGTPPEEPKQPRKTSAELGRSAANTLRYFPESLYQTTTYPFRKAGEFGAGVVQGVVDEMSKALFGE